MRCSERQQRSNEAAESRQGTVGDMAVDLTGDMGEVALDLAHFRARQGAARDNFLGVRSARRGRIAVREVARLQV